MAIYHLHFSRVQKSKAQSAKAKFDYISRLDKYKDKVGFQLSESHNMPIFAQENPSLFWQAADTHERSNGRVCNEVKLALPKELNLEQQRDLVFEYAQKMLPHSPYTFAIHENENGDNPHCHLIFSERILNARTLKLSPDKFFKRASKNKQSKDTGGAEKDTYFQKKDFLAGEYGLRKTWTRITNEHLAKHGFDARIDDRPAKEQGKIENGHLPRTEYLQLKALKQQKSQIDDQIEQITQRIENAQSARINNLIIESHRRLSGTQQTIERAELRTSITEHSIGNARQQLAGHYRDIQSGIEELERVNQEQNLSLSNGNTASTEYTNGITERDSAGARIYPSSETIRRVIDAVKSLTFETYIQDLERKDQERIERERIERERIERERNSLYNDFINNQNTLLDTIYGNYSKAEMWQKARPPFIWQYETRLGSRDLEKTRMSDTIKKLLDHLKAIDKAMQEMFFDNAKTDQFSKNAFSKALYASDFFNGETTLSGKQSQHDHPFMYYDYGSIFTASIFNRNNENLFEMIFKNEPQQAAMKIWNFAINKINALIHNAREWFSDIPREQTPREFNEQMSYQNRRFR